MKVLKDSKGFTLIELLLTLAISGIIITMIYSVFINGLTRLDRENTKVLARQDADYVMEQISNAFYQEEKNKARNEYDPEIFLEINNGIVKLNGTKISNENFSYEKSTFEGEYFSDSDIPFSSKKTVKHNLRRLSVNLVVKDSSSHTLSVSSTFLYQWDGDEN
ncbi:PilW family protein [Pseudalkalibacillus caeni]|uniref:PilW family protein n=1 Tax=Exobacillus caeni TaxID=2574798 RepID=UPI0014857184|nr:prepilin-type N-terminal cleavage/methylation domain-containing protein [Pseudalkalibacillus caeni]